MLNYELTIEEIIDAFEPYMEGEEFEDFKEGWERELTHPLESVNYHARLRDFAASDDRFYDVFRLIEI